MHKFYSIIKIALKQLESLLNGRPYEKDQAHKSRTEVFNNREAQRAHGMA